MKHVFTAEGTVIFDLISSVLYLSSDPLTTGGYMPTEMANGTSGSAILTDISNTGTRKRYGT